MSRSHITIEQLQGIAREHLPYEIDMFVYSGDQLMKGELSIAERNVMIETFLLHARCLYNFLYPSETPWKDDVLADDFFEDSNELRDKLPKKLAISSYLNYRAGKEVAHLTYDRLKVTPQGKQWQVDEVHNEISKALEVFFDTLTKERRDWFPKRIPYNS